VTTAFPQIGWVCPISVLALPILSNEEEHRGVVKGHISTIALTLLGLPMPALRNHLRNDPERKAQCSDHNDKPFL